MGTLPCDAASRVSGATALDMGKILHEEVQGSRPAPHALIQLRFPAHVLPNATASLLLGYTWADAARACGPAGRARGCTRDSGDTRRGTMETGQTNTDVHRRYIYYGRVRRAINLGTPAICASRVRSRVRLVNNTTPPHRQLRSWPIDRCWLISHSPPDRRMSPIGAGWPRCR